MKIHIIFAMQGEAKHVIDTLKLKLLEHSSGNFNIYQGIVQGHTIHLFVNQKDENDMDRLGTMQVGLLTYKAIQFEKPDLILNLGTCGGIHDHEIRLFDIICSNQFVIYHDRFTGDSENSIKQSLRFSPSINLEDSIHLKNLKHGVIASSNSLFVSKTSWGVIHKYNVLCLDMEAAAIAEVSNDCSIPFIAFKVVTDNVYEVNPVDAFSQFEANFHPAMELLASQVPLILQQLPETPRLFHDKQHHQHIPQCS